VFALVALLVTVKVELPDWSAVNEADPDSPVPDTAIVSVPLFAAVGVPHEVVEPFVVRNFPELPVCAGAKLSKAPVAVVEFVPPFAIGKVPDTWVVKPTLPYDGAVVTPPESKTLPVATPANLLRVVEPDA
jgi:hypothetical protein